MQWWTNQVSSLLSWSLYLVNKINSNFSKLCAYEAKGKVKRSMHFIKWLERTRFPTSELWVEEWGVSRERISQAEEKVCTKVLWRHFWWGGECDEMRLGSRWPERDSLHVTRVRSFAFLLSVMGSHWSTEDSLSKSFLCVNGPVFLSVSIFRIAYSYVDTAGLRARL